MIQFSDVCLRLEDRDAFMPMSSPPHVAAVSPCLHAADLHERGIVLPAHPNLTRADVVQVCETLQECIS